MNDLTAQHLLLDRRRVYNTLLEHGIPVPRHCVVDRDGGRVRRSAHFRAVPRRRSISPPPPHPPAPPQVPALAPTACADEDFEETEEAVRVGATKVSKPFVEKPVSAEDHNICIYYGATDAPNSRRPSESGLARAQGTRWVAA